MKSILLKLTELQSSPISKQIEERLRDFSEKKNLDEQVWFSELCFCLLTANAKAKTALAIEAELYGEGYWSAPKRTLLATLKKHHHRFHNTKTNSIIAARSRKKTFKHELQRLISTQNQKEGRAFLVHAFKGLGYKEASHFLRNMGYESVAIVDRHILRLLYEEKILTEIPSSITPAAYLAIEHELERIAKKANMTLAKLDLYLWYIKTGRVLK